MGRRNPGFLNLRGLVAREAPGSTFTTKKGENMRRRFAVLLTAAFVPVFGAAACGGGGIEEGVQQRVEEEVQEGQQQVEEQVEEQVQEATLRVEQETQEARQQIEQEAQEVQKQVEEQVGVEQP